MRHSNRRDSFPGLLSYGRGSVMAILLAAGWLLFSGYVINTDGQLQHPRWLTFPIKLEVWSGFSDVLDNIEDGSRPKLALREAMERWTRVSSLSVLYAEADEADAGDDSIGGGRHRNVVTIRDNEDHRKLTEFTLATTVILTERSSTQIGLSPSPAVEGPRILETDVVFDPTAIWTTIEPDSRSSDVKNLLDVAQHEFGHVWNLNHTISRGSAMYFQGGSFGFDFNEPSWDDIAGINSTAQYRMIGLDRITGSISGRITLNGSAVFGAFVSAVDEYGQLAASAISVRDGKYELKFLPPGSYTLYVEPLDGPVTAAQIIGGIFDLPMQASFLPRFYNDSLAPQVEVVVDRITSEVDFAVSAGTNSIDPDLIEVVEDTSDFAVFSSRAEGPKDSEVNFIVAGEGADELSQDSDGLFFLRDYSDTSLAGPVAHLKTGAFVEEGDLANGEPFRIFPLEISAATPEGDYSAFLRGDSSGQLGVISGALRVHSSWRFLQAFGQFAHFPGLISSEIFLVNTNINQHAAAMGVLSARDAAGFQTPLDLDLPGSSQAFALHPGGSLRARTRGDVLFLGSLRTRADQRVGGTVLFESSQGTTGVSASLPLYSFVAPFEVRDGGNTVNTGFAIANLDARPVDLHVQAQNEAGQTVENGTAVLRIEGNGQLSLFVGDPSGSGNSLLPGLPGNFKGTIALTANRKIAATVIRTSPGILTTLPVIQNRVRRQSFFAQFAHDSESGLSSELLLVNPSPSQTAANVLVKIRDSSGRTVPVRLQSDGSLEILPAGQKTVTISPLGSVSIRTGGNLVGSVEVISDIPVGGVVLFRSASAGTTGVGESLAQSKAVLPLSRSRNDEIEMGIAVVNTEDHAITLTVIARDADGNIVAGPRPIQLSAREQFAESPNGDKLALGLADSFTGSLWLEASGDSRFAATVIRFSPGVLTTFPAISLEHFVNADQ